ncbi:hypothetical protein F2Q69_00008810 [Brassica cretica]|uniref:Uncharacterized protein n=1 Tax=Brassica cretica TaxID=69181 RepID=A0A8S9PMQ8_BRACR|nr:hypothetical protein F2Q69_00008810 [Brassica cretica]
MNCTEEECDLLVHLEGGGSQPRLTPSLMGVTGVGYLLDGENQADILWEASSVSGLEIHRRDLDFNGWIFGCLGFSEAGRHSSSAGQSWVFGKSDVKLVVTVLQRDSLGCLVNPTVRSSLLELRFGGGRGRHLKVESFSTAVHAVEATAACKVDFDNERILQIGS